MWDISGDVKFYIFSNCWNKIQLGHIVRGFLVEYCRNIDTQSGAPFHSCIIGTPWKAEFSTEREHQYIVTTRDSHLG